MAERDARHHEKDLASLADPVAFPAVFTAVYLVPAGRSVYDSLFDTRMASDGAQYVGLDNFSRLFADGVFWQSLVNNLLYILLTVVPGVTLALLLAVALSENHRVNRWLRTAFFFPMIIPMVSAAALWLFIFMPGLGLLDHYLAKLFGR